MFYSHTYIFGEKIKKLFIFTIFFWGGGEKINSLSREGRKIYFNQ